MTKGDNWADLAAVTMAARSKKVFDQVTAPSPLLARMLVNEPTRVRAMSLRFRIATVLRWLEMLIERGAAILGRLAARLEQ